MIKINSVIFNQNQKYRIMKTVYLALTALIFVSFTTLDSSSELKENNKTAITIASSFSLINDTKAKVSIYTGSGFVSLNKGSKTSISCKVGKEVRWANKGKKGAVIFKIEDNMCGKTLKLSQLLD